MKTSFKSKVLAIYDLPDHRRMSIPTADEAKTYFHPIDFEKEPTMTLGGLEFVLDRQGWGHTLHNVWTYRNKKTDIGILFAKKKSKHGSEDPGVPEIHHTKATIIRAIADDRMMKMTAAIAEDLKKRGYDRIKITGPSGSRTV